jgi:hypothetical protein
VNARRLALALSPLAAIATLGSCNDLERFDTGESGAYCGSIIDSDFTRAGFDPGIAMRLTLDIDALAVAPGTISTNDAAGPCSPSPEFVAAPLRVTPELFSDPLSQLEFGQNRDHNFMAWVDSTCRGSALAVVSLMHTGQVEVRLLRSGNGLAGDGAPNELGVFQLERTNCEL